MKKTRLFLICTLILALTGILLAGCSKEDRIASVYLKDYEEGTLIETAMGVFDYAAHTVVVEYTSGRTELVTLTEDMVEEADLFKLYQEGEHDITVNYGRYKCSFRISVKRSTFGALYLTENNVFTYDGKAHTVEVTGDLPANAVVTYPGGNSFVNAGTYDVVAIVSCDGYVTERLSTTVKIEKAKYDMSSVTLESKEVTYDGKSHSITISGKLPEGVSAPTYYINGKVANGATDSGEYTVTARFTTKNANYETIPDMVATLKINPADYKMHGVNLIFKNEEGNAIEDTKVYDGKAVSCDLNDYSKLTGKVGVSFTVYDEQGNVISNSNKITGIKNAGTYTVKVEFTLSDAKNYNPIEPIVRDFVVTKAPYNLDTNVYLDSDTLEYDGAPHLISIVGSLPAGVSVSYEYYLADQLLVDTDGNLVQSVTDAGRYTIKAIFTHEDKNYQDIPPITATLYISVATLEIPQLSGVYSEEYEYDGTAKKLELDLTDTIPDGVEITYEYYLDGELVKDADGAAATSVTEVGLYTVKIIVSVTNPNYIFVGDLSAVLTVIDTNN